MPTLIELKKQTILLQELNANITGLRADMKAAGKEGVEKGMKDAMAQVAAAFKGTPFEGMIAKMGGNHG